MSHRIILVFFLAALASTTFGQQKTTGYANVNGQKLYYEITGQGDPIVLLHGAYMDIDANWGQIIPELSKNKKVIAIEAQGHGRSHWTNRPLTFDALADDVDKILQLLKVDSADIVGYSFGGTIAFNMAIKYPKRVKKLVVISSTYKTAGWQKEVQDILSSMTAEFLEATPMRANYAKIAPDSTQWNAFAKGMVALNKQPFNLGDDNIQKIKATTLLISGDNDGIDKTLLLEVYKKLDGGSFADMAGVPKSHLAIIPGQGHVSLMMDQANILRLLLNFL